MGAMNQRTHNSNNTTYHDEHLRYAGAGGPSDRRADDHQRHALGWSLMNDTAQSGSGAMARTASRANVASLRHFDNCMSDRGEIIQMTVNDQSVACALVRPPGISPIVDVLVRQEHRRRGHGQAIFDHTVATLFRDASAATVQLNVVNRRPMRRIVTNFLQRNPEFYSDLSGDTWIIMSRQERERSVSPQRDSNELPEDHADAMTASGGRVSDGSRHRQRTQDSTPQRSSVPERSRCAVRAVTDALEYTYGRPREYSDILAGMVEIDSQLPEGDRGNVDGFTDAAITAYLDNINVPYERKVRLSAARTHASARSSGTPTLRPRTTCRRLQPCAMSTSACWPSTTASTTTRSPGGTSPSALRLRRQRSGSSTLATSSACAWNLSSTSCSTRTAPLRLCRTTQPPSLSTSSLPSTGRTSGRCCLAISPTHDASRTRSRQSTASPTSTALAIVVAAEDGRARRTRTLASA